MSTAANFAIAQKKIAVIVTINAETSAAPRTISDIRSVLRSCKIPFTLVLVRNGHLKPQVAEYLEAICFSEATIHCVTLGSRVSPALAIRAGLDAVDADAYITISADGSDDVRAITNMIRKWSNGSEVVLAVREEADELKLHRRMVKAAYRSIGKRCSVPVAYGASDCTLMDRRVVNTLKALPADDRTLAQQTSRLGFRRSIIGMETTWRRPESLRQRAMNHIRSLRETILSHSRMPIRMIYWSAASVFTISMLGSLVASTAIAMGASFTVVFTVLMSACLFAISSIMASCVVMGEYLYRLMQNGPAARRFAVVDQYTPSCKMPTVQIRKTVSEDDILSELNNLHGELKAQTNKRERPLAHEGSKAQPI